VQEIFDVPEELNAILAGIIKQAKEQYVDFS